MLSAHHIAPFLRDRLPWAPIYFTDVLLYAFRTVESRRPSMGVPFAGSAPSQAQRDSFAAWEADRDRLQAAADAAIGWLSRQGGDAMRFSFYAHDRLFGEKATQAAREIAARDADWSQWAEDFDSYCARIDAANADRIAAGQARAAAEAPALALSAAEAEIGSPLGLDESGEHIVAPAGAGLSDTTVAAVKEHKQALLVLLKQRAAAAGTVVVA